MGCSITTFNPSFSEYQRALARSSYSQLGDYAGQRLALERSLAIREKLGRVDHKTAGVLFPLARVCNAEGDRDAALSFAQRAVRLMEAAPATEQAPLLQLSLAALGDVLRDQGRYEEAYGIYDRLHRYWSEGLGPEDGNVAWMLSVKSYVLSAQGKHAEALKAAQVGLRIKEKDVGPEDRTLVMHLRYAALALISAGDDAGAEPLLLRAVRLRERAYGSNAPGLRGLLDDLAMVRYRLGTDSDAVDTALRSESIGREAFQNRLRILSERQIYQYETSRASSLQVALAVLDRGSRAVASGQIERVWDELVRSRALVLDELIARQRAATGEPDVNGLLQELQVAKARLAALVLNGADPAGGIDDAQARKERAEQELARRSAEYRRRLAQHGVGLASVRKALPPNSALVSYVEWERPVGASRETARRPAPSTPERHYAAFVLTGASRSFVPLGPADAIETLVGRWQQSVGEGPPPRPGVSETRYRYDGMELRKKIWDPLAHALAGSKIAFIVPDGALHLVNLATLPVGEEGYLVETTPLIHYLSTERDLVLQPRKQYAQGDVLIVGGPDPDAAPSGSPAGPRLAEARLSERPGGPASGSRSVHRSQPAACVDFRSTRFDRLSGATAEAVEVKDLWANSTGVVVLTGADATESAFKLEAPGRRLLHLATHGFFVQDQCLSAYQSARARGTEARLPGQEPRPAVGDNPLLLSGLILAGANRRGELTPGGDGEDGILTAEEVGALDLSGVEWAVLSACETGIGKVRAGEGVLGLRRAFEVAGAGTLITSLWRVDDDATRIWMRNLYRARLAGRPTMEAVRDASLSMLQENRSKGRTTHPFYWGGFVAAGDWR